MGATSKADSELISGGVFLFAMSLVTMMKSIFMVLPMGMIIYMVLILVFCILCTVLLAVGTKDKIDELSQGNN
jgi:ABC-type transport system involved in multi-copper enzyme maturation permease subunit